MSSSPPGIAVVPGVPTVPREILAALAKLRMTGLEWQVVVAVLLSSEPMSARQIAASLRRPYGPVKRLVRELVAWRILERTPAGLRFQSDSVRWGPPGQEYESPN